ncbi:MAG: alpha-2-macroglobulin [Saprospiraceae bacterium]|nr:alpha-2-macroglobulin [Saprospiraceae bacterium]
MRTSNLCARLLALVLLLPVFFPACSQPSKISKSMTHGSDDPYKQEWKSIDSLEQRGLYQSALESVNRLYGQALRDNQPSEMVKTLLYKSRYIQQLEEEGMEASILAMKAEAEKAPHPARAVLESVLGELYFSYLEQNRYQLEDRSTIADFRPADLKTWSMAQLADESARLYLASVRHSGLENVPIQQYDAVTTPAKLSDELRPSLFDFLAHRAIDHFSNERGYLSKPAYRFYLEQEQAFAPAQDFIQHSFSTRDTSSFHHRAVLLFQQLLRLRTPQSDLPAHLDADLKRLKFAYEHSTHPDKEQLYKNALERSAKQYPKEPLIAEYWHAVAEWQVKSGQDYDPKMDEDDKKWALREAVAICDRVIKAFPGTLGAELCAATKAGITAKSLIMQAEQVSVPGQSVLVSVEYQNITAAHIKIVPLQWTDRERLQRYETAKDLDWLDKIKPAQQLSLAWKDLGDYRAHRTEAALKGLAPGFYAIIISDNDKFKIKEHTAGFLTIQVSNIAFLNRSGGEDGTEFLLLDRHSGAPMPGVKGEFYQVNYDWTKRERQTRKLTENISDADGSMTVNVTQNTTFEGVFSKGNDKLHSENAFSSYRYFYRRVTQVQTQFFLDRAIYRPGQTVYFKGLVTETDADGMPRILDNQAVTVTFFDANGQETGKQELRSNRYGTFNGSFQAPAGGLAGMMYLQSSAGNSTIYFRVEEYKRPRFEVIMAPVEGSPALGEVVEVKGKAQAYAGSAVDGAMVQYRVVREVYYPWLPWWYWRGGGFNRTETMELANGETRTDAEGNFSVSFTAAPDPTAPKKRQPAFRYSVYADVTDINGETQSGEKSIQLAWQSLLASVQVPESIDRSTTPKLGISTTNLDGQKIPAIGVVSVDRLKSPDRTLVDRLWPTPDQPLLSRDAFIKAFPNLPYQEEHRMENLAVDARLWEGAFNTAESEELILKWEDLRPGHYLLTLRTADGAGNPIESKHWFTLYDSQTREAPANAVFWSSRPKSSYQPEEALHLPLAATGGPLHLLLETERNEKVLDKAQRLKIEGWFDFNRIIGESERGGFHVQTTAVRFNRVFSQQHFVNVPWNNKELKVEYATFRDKLLPGQQEEWRIKISGPNGERVAAEMLAAMYDVSLDQFASNNWGLSLFPTYAGSRNRWSAGLFSSTSARMQDVGWNKYPVMEKMRVYRSLIGMDLRYGYYGKRLMSRNVEMMEMAPAPMSVIMDADGALPGDRAAKQAEDSVATEQKRTEEKPAPPPPGVRTNLKETVFFLPDLMTDAEGNVIIKFTMNEALTRWKFLGMALTTDLKTATFSREVVTQKDLMVLPNAPRFVREGDVIEFTAKVSNLTDKTLAGTARLELFDAVTMQPVDALLGNTNNQVSLSAPAGQSAPLTWTLRIPYGQVMALTHRVTAQAGAFSDGEESSIPVLTNRMLVTETLPMSVRGGKTQTFTLANLRDAKSPTLEHHKLTLEFTSNPAWYAVQALPYLMEYPYECIEQVFNRFYANTLASAVTNSHPNIKKVFDGWKGTDALQSNLMKNEELKYALLQETPWVLAAQKESEQRQNIALLFDLHRMAKEQQEAIDKIAQRQMPSGGFAWFNGGQENWYMTQYIVEGFGHLRQLKALSAENNAKATEVAAKAVRHIDERIAREYEELEKRVKEGKAKLEDDHLSHLVIHYLYARSFFPELAIEKRAEKARNYYTEQAVKYWLQKGIYQEGMLAMALHRSGNATATRSIVNSLRERALRSEELGMYWKYDRGYFWYQMPIETHALMIEVFSEAAKDEKSVEELKLWLLKNKQTTNWKTTKATASAVYALLGFGENWLVESDKPVQVSFDKNTQRMYADRITTAQADAQAGSGYFKTSWEGKEVNAGLASIKVKNPNKVVAWGSAYWQYFEDLDKIKTFEATPLTIKKQLFREEASDTGPVLRTLENNRALRPGDKLIVRVELRVDRDMEYVHLKDMRASGFEPINVLSTYKWQGGLGYYESTGDAATNFFMDYLPKGTYVFEYPLRVAHNGDFSNGITTIQCMYAPEFTSHSQGVKVKVGEGR